MQSRYRRTNRIGLALGALVGAGVIGVAGTAEANDDKVDPHYWSDYDHNQDGTLDHVERDAMHYDQDGDGHLDPIERDKLDSHLWQMDTQGDLYYDDGLTGRRRQLAFRSRQAARLFIRFDRNRDGVLARWEARRGLTMPFRRIDRNRDGVITPRELDRMFIYRGSPRRAVRQQYGGRGGISYGFRLQF